MNVATLHKNSLKPNGDFTQHVLRSFHGDETCIANHWKKGRFQFFCSFVGVSQFLEPQHSVEFFCLKLKSNKHITKTKDLLRPKKKVRLRSHGFSSNFTLLQKVAEKIQLQPALKNPGVLEDHNSPPQHKLIQNHQPGQITTIINSWSWVFQVLSGEIPWS